MTDSGKTSGIFAPLGNPGFATLWGANTLSLTAFWMTEVACAWQMRIMTDADPLLVAAVYTALQLPIMFLVIPAGVLADLADRRRGMIWTHAWLGLSSGLLLWLILSGRVTPLLLLACLPLIAIGQAMRMPGIAALIPDMVQSTQIPAAVSLNNFAQTGSRLIGPALAGAIIAAMGVAPVLALNTAIMALIVLLFLQIRYRREDDGQRLTRRRFVHAVREGLMFAAFTSWKRNILIRLGSFFACASSVPALMAVLFDDSRTYGLMYSCFGGGSLLGVVAIARLGHRRLDRRLSGAVLFCALCMMLFGGFNRPAVAAPLLACIGASWIFCTNTIMVAAQTQLDPAMRGRGLSYIFTLGTISMAGGGLLWGAVARAVSPAAALITAGACLLACLTITHRLSMYAPPPATGTEGAM